MELKELFWTYLHSPRLLEALEEEFEFSTVEDLYKWLKTFPEASEVVLNEFFEDRQDMIASCEEMLNVSNTI